MKLAVIFGGSSNEHEVSVVSASSIIKNLDKNKYDITPIYMDKQNIFYKWLDDVNKIEVLKIGTLPNNIEKIDNFFQYIKEFDLVFIMIHGKNGEDGIISSILDFLNVKYIGNKPSASMITMDKIFTKDILERNNIKTSKYLYFTKYNDEYIYKDLSLNLEGIIEEINHNLKYPLFVKPANSGSSIGITKVLEKDKLKEAILLALQVDSRILVEEGVVGKEVECGILEKDGKVMASRVGEVIASDEFYSFDAKYNNSESLTLIPAKLPEKIEDNVRSLAIKVFKILNCHGYSRCDFFIRSDNEIILNEINTIPGFTEISMYPKLFLASNIPYKELLDILINEAIKRN